MHLILDARRLFRYEKYAIVHAKHANFIKVQTAHIGEPLWFRIAVYQSLLCFCSAVSAWRNIDCTNMKECYSDGQKPSENYEKNRCLDGVCIAVGHRYIICPGCCTC